MAKKKKAEPAENHERWLVSYADYMTLLFALFVVLYSLASNKQYDFNAMVKAFMDSMSKVGLISRPTGSPMLEGGTGILNINVPVSVLPDPAGKVQMTPKATEQIIAQPDQIQVKEVQTGKPQGQQESETLSTANDLQAALMKLRHEVADDDVEVELLGQQLLIRMADASLFAQGSAFLQPSQIPRIEKIAHALKDMPGTIVVTGYTDNRIPDGLYNSNWNLSTDRAVSIVKVFLKPGLIDASRVIAQGRADTHPVVANDSEEHRAKNRRIEVVITQGEPKEEQADVEQLEATAPKN